MAVGAATPLLVTVLGAPPAGAPADAVARVPAPRRDRVVLAWPGAARSGATGDLVAAARSAGFRRIRLLAPGRDLSAGVLDSLCAAGLDEVEVRADGPAPWEALRSLRSSGRLAFTAVRWGAAALGAAPDADPPDPCGADAFVLDVGPAGPPPGADRLLAGAAARHRRVAVRGWPLCAFPSLPADRLVANALVADLGGPRDPAGTGRLRLPFEDPARVYGRPCAGCSLSLACDGLPVSAFAVGGGGEAVLQPFGGGLPERLSLDPAGLVSRVHPPSFLSGRAHLAAVWSGARPCGRSVLEAGEARRLVADVHALGLQAAVLAGGDIPRDGDPGAGARGGAVHVFFSRGDEARVAAGLTARFASGQDGSSPQDPAAFGRDLGRLLGYPECCIEAFVGAGPAASTTDLLRAAHGRSGAFHAPLNVLDPASPLTLLPHLPCRFDCAPSGALAARVLQALDGVHPFLASTALHALARPWVLWDARRAVSLPGPADADGRGAPVGAVDSPAWHPGVPRDAAVDAFLARMAGALAGGGHLRVDDGLVRILRDDDPVDLSGEGRGLVFPFAVSG